MRLLCDKPSKLKEALNDKYPVDYSPALDIYTKSNSLLQTLKGFYVSSKLIDFELKDDENIYNLIVSKAENIIDKNREVKCYACYNYDDFDNFCKQYIDNNTAIRLAYDVETNAAPFLSKRYKLAGFSLANEAYVGCYVVLDSIDYQNPDEEKCKERLRQVLRTHKILVFNAQHEYLATNICLDLDLNNETVSFDDAYAMALTLKTESFKSDVFKLKVLCHRLLGTDNWASIIDDYIDIAIKIGSFEYNKDSSNEVKEAFIDLISSYEEIISEYGYNHKDATKFINKLRSTYHEWKDQGTLPYNLIPSRMVSLYGCYDSCYLTALFDFFLDWAKDLEYKLVGLINKPNIELAYKECVQSQIASAILTVNGVFISDERDEEVYNRAKTESDKYYNKLWDVVSDVSHEVLLKECIRKDPKHQDKMYKKYIIPKYIDKLVPDFFDLISTTPSYYSFTVKRTEIDDYSDKFIEDNKLKPNKNGEYKILQKHLKSLDEAFDDVDEIYNSVIDDYLKDCIEKDGSLAEKVYTPMSSPETLLKLLTRDLNYSKFLSRVVLFEYDNLPENLKNPSIVKFLDENLLYNFDDNIELYDKYANVVKEDVIEYLSKQYSYKEIYEKLVQNGIKSFASPIIAYIYTIYTATGCTVYEPKYSAFDYICKLKICRKYKRIISTFIIGSSGGYASQKYVDNNSIYNKYLTLATDNVTSKEDNKTLLPAPNNTSRVVFGSWYANTAETGRWKATIHNVPAGAFCKRRFTSRFGKMGLILANDMSQAEVRELAAVSKAKDLLEIIKDPHVDIHRKTASLAFNVPYDEVTSTQRKQTKTGIFSVVYGREEQSLAQELFNGDKKAAERLMNSIFKVYPEIPEYLQDCWEGILDTGYIVTRRGCPIFVNPYTQEFKNKGEQAVKRLSRNYSIQGGASHWCTHTLVNIQKMFDKYNLKSKVIAYIHDSIEVDVHIEEFDTAFHIMNVAFNELASKMFGLPTASDTVVGVSMGEELDITRLEKYHYIIEGNNDDVIDVINQLNNLYDIEIIDKQIDDVVDKSEDVNWIFVPRAELQWYNKKTPAKYEFKMYERN